MGEMLVPPLSNLGEFKGSSLGSPCIGSNWLLSGAFLFRPHSGDAVFWYFPAVAHGQNLVCSGVLVLDPLGHAPRTGVLGCPEMIGCYHLAMVTRGSWREVHQGGALQLTACGSLLGGNRLSLLSAKNRMSRSQARSEVPQCSGPLSFPSTLTFPWVVVWPQEGKLHEVLSGPRVCVCVYVWECTSTQRGPAALKHVNVL